MTDITKAIPELTVTNAENESTLSEAERKSVEILYQEGVRIHLYNVEWRHKIMSRFFISVVALVFVAKWMLESNTDQIMKYSYLPFILVTIVSLGFFLWDRRIVSQINTSYKVGVRLERKLNDEGGHFMEQIKDGRDLAGNLNGRTTIVSYTFVLEFFFLLTGAISLFFFILLL